MFTERVQRLHSQTIRYHRVVGPNFKVYAIEFPTGPRSASKFRRVNDLRRGFDSAARHIRLCSKDSEDRSETHFLPYRYAGSTDSDQSSRHRTLTGCVECGDTVLNSSEASLNCMLECKSTTKALPNTELAIKTAQRLLATLPVVAILNAHTSRDRLLYLGDSS